MTSNEQEFARARHMALAVVALVVYLAITGLGWRPVEAVGLREPWDGPAYTLRRALHLAVVVVPAWLAFAALDTKAGVELLGSRWREAGRAVVLLSGVFVVANTAVRYAASPEVLDGVSGLYGVFEDGVQVQWAWLIAFFVVSAFAEEIVFRALLQRALEGYMELPYAITIQALVFEGVHVLHGAKLTGGFFFGGVVFGLAFARTRNLALAVVLHVFGNLFHALLFAGL